jgi:large subunit ribosomal protein L7Ae
MCVYIYIYFFFYFFQIRRHWGGGVMGNKSQARITKLEKAKARELAQKMG